ncbi:hypothetical protein DVH05_027115 [Phytophthora capsici]|nr:hypothetical protein DVH05_027115 [Phytophthora capsici]
MERQHDLCMILALTSLVAVLPLLAAISARLVKLLTPLGKLQQALPVADRLHLRLSPAPVLNLFIELGRGQLNLARLPGDYVVVLSGFVARRSCAGLVDTGEGLRGSNGAFTLVPYGASEAESSVSKFLVGLAEGTWLIPSSDGSPD